MKKERIKKFLLNPWTITICGALFSFVLTLLSDAIRGEQILSTFVFIVAWIWNIIVSFLTFSLKVWWVLIGVAVIILGLWSYSKILNARSSSSSIPKFLGYTQDFLLGFKWEWTWEKDYYGKYSVENLQPICTDCDTPLRYDFTGFYRLKCLRCNKSYSGNVPQEDDVKTLIYDNVKKKYFKRKEEN